MPSILSRVHAQRQTPTIAIVFTTLIAVCLIATGDVGNLARTTVLLLLLAFIVVNISVLVLRREAVEHQHFRAPVIFPLLGTVVCVGLLTQQAAEVWWRAGALLALGAILYGVNVLAKRRLDTPTTGTPSASA